MECLKRIILICGAVSYGFIFGWFFSGTVYFYCFEYGWIHGWIFWSIAFGWSGFLAGYAFQLHNIQKRYKCLPWSQQVHQFILNFLGGFTGWLILYLFLAKTNTLASFTGWEKIILLVISFVGVTGYLPYALLILGWLPGKK